jgi:alcohol dehydrogenase class IV
MHFEFATAARIVFGSGKIREAISTAASLGRRALIVTGSTPSRLETFLDGMRAQEMECTLFPIHGEPTIPGILKGVQTAKDAGCELVIGCGGGSALDGAKAIAALMTNPGIIWKWSAAEIRLLNPVHPVSAFRRRPEPDARSRGIPCWSLPNTM